MTRTLLVTVDDTLQTETVTEYIGSVYNSVEVTLLHVIRYTEKKTSPSRGGRNKPERWYADACEGAEDLFRTATDRLGGAADTIDTVIRSGTPSEEILTYADEQDPDEIVIGLRKRNPTGKVLFGSTAQDVLLSSTRPIIAVPLTGS